LECFTLLKNFSPTVHPTIGNKMSTTFGQWTFNNPVMPNVLQYKQAETLTFDELVFIDNYGKKNAGYATVVLPYALALDKEIVDSIAKKMKMNRYYRGPRNAPRRGNACRTLKKHAEAVALYRKYNIKE
jgi:hypothetical protein